MYEIFDHTADLGLRIRADDLPQLFEDAGRALFSTIVVNLDGVRPVEEVTFEIEAERCDELLRDWLAELLYVFHVRHLLFSRFEVHIEENKVHGTARGEPLDPARHTIDTEIKAVTYHGLKVERDEAGWVAEVIVDI